MSDDLRYELGPRMIRLAQATVQSMELPKLARPLLTQLAREIGHDVYLAVGLGRRVFYVDRCAGDHRLSLAVQIGVPLYLHSTATGKLFAAFDARLHAEMLRRPRPQLTAHTLVDAEALDAEMAAIRERGWADSCEETVEGIIGYSVPVWSQEASAAQKPVLAAAVHVSVIGGMGQRAGSARVVDAALACAGRIEQRLASVSGRERPRSVGRREALRNSLQTT